MGICQEERHKEKHQKLYIEYEPTMTRLELYTGHKPVPMNIANQALKSICKIIVETKNIYGTGFFMRVDESKKYLITNYHILSEDGINDEITIEIHNHKEI